MHVTACNEAQYRDLAYVYNYICSVASLSSIHAPPLVQTFTQKDSLDHHPFFGAYADLYLSLHRVGRLIPRGENPTALEEDQLQSEVDGLALPTHNWDLLDDNISSSSRPSSDAQAAATCTLSAISILLRQIQLGDFRLSAVKNYALDPTRKEARNHILSAISLIRPGSEMEPRMLFPLFMAGLTSMTKANRLTVEHRLHVLEATIGFGNVSYAHKLLEDVWRRLNAGETVDWRLLMQTEYSGLVLL